MTIASVLDDVLHSRSISHRTILIHMSIKAISSKGTTVCFHEVLALFELEVGLVLVDHSVLELSCAVKQGGNNKKGLFPARRTRFHHCRRIRDIIGFVSP